MSTTTRQENKAVVREFFERLDEQDLNAIDDLLAEGYTTGIYRSGSEEGIEGREGMKELWREYLAAFPDLTGASLDLIAEDDRVAFFRVEEGTHEGPFRGIEATGNDITWEYAGFVTVEDGQIVHGHFRGNVINLLKQLGVDPPIPR